MSGERVIDDLWTTFPNVHLRVLAAEKGAVEIQICDCGMGRTSIAAIRKDNDV